MDVLTLMWSVDKGDPSAGHTILKEGGCEKKGRRSKFFWIEASTMGDWIFSLIRTIMKCVDDQHEEMIC